MLLTPRASVAARTVSSGGRTPLRTRSRGAARPADGARRGVAALVPPPRANPRPLLRGLRLQRPGASPRRARASSPRGAHRGSFLPPGAGACPVPSPSPPHPLGRAPQADLPDRRPRLPSLRGHPPRRGSRSPFLGRPGPSSSTCGSPPGRFPLPRPPPRPSSASGECRPTFETRPRLTTAPGLLYPPTGHHLRRALSGSLVLPTPARRLGSPARASATKAPFVLPWTTASATS